MGRITKWFIVICALYLLSFGVHAKIELPPAEEVRVLIDNQEAYKSKVNLIQKAQSSIQMIYYIYSDDESSSFLTNLLIQKAQQGIQVKILLDLHNNYHNLDLFRMMEKEGKGNLKVRFFHAINSQIIKNIVFMTSGCSKNVKNNNEQCKNERLERAEQIASLFELNQKNNIKTKLPVMSSIFLAGLYGKSMTALQLGIAPGTGERFKQLKQSIRAPKGSDTSTSQSLSEWLKPVEMDKEAPVTGREALKFQLGIIAQTSDMPLEQTMELINLVMPDKLDSSNRGAVSWIHFTDFVHHKLLLVDGQYVQLGGRNIENSYHLNKKIFSGDKYLFKDTDVVINFENPAKGLQQSFERLYGFKTMVMTMDELLHYFNNNILLKLPELQEGYIRCIKTNLDDYEKCVEDILSKEDENLAERFENIYAQMLERSQNPSVQAAIDSPGQFFWKENSNDKLSSQDLSKVKITYLENLPFNTSSYTPHSQRLMFQKNLVAQSEASKQIHETVIQGIETVCQKATNEFNQIPVEQRETYLQDNQNRKHIILYQGYVFFPGVLMISLGKTVNQQSVEDNNNQLHCPGVDIEIFTNSSATTDLNIINILSRPQIALLIDEQRRSTEYYNEMIQSDPNNHNYYPPATIRYYTLTPPMIGPNIDFNQLMSLHSKVFILDDFGILIGSANGDLRSYFMDTNNGVLIQDADQFTNDFTQWFESLKTIDDDGNVVFKDETPELANLGQQMNAQKESGNLIGLLKTVYEDELKMLVEAKIDQWQHDATENPESNARDINNKIAKLRQYLPYIISSIAFLANEVYQTADQFVSGKLSSQKLNIIKEKFRTLFGVL